MFGAAASILRESHSYTLGHALWQRLVLGVVAKDVGSPMGEQRFIHFEQCLLIVHKEVQQVVLVFCCEVHQAHTALRQLRQSQQGLLEVLRLLDRLVHVVKLLARVDFILESAPHDLLPDLLDALDKERFQIISLDAGVRLLRNSLALRQLFFLDDVLERADKLVVVGFECLDVLYYVVFHVGSCHFRLKNFSYELFKLYVPGRDLLVI